MQPTPEWGSATLRIQQFSRKRKRPEEGQQLSEEQCTDLVATAGKEAPILSASRGGKGKQLTQMYLDVGQRDFHSTRCATCGMLYTPGDAADDRLHAAFHANATKGLRYHAAQSDKVLATDGTRGKIVVVSVSGAAKQKRLIELVAFLEEQMGLVKGWLLAVPSSIFLYVSMSTRRILGCTVTEGIQQAYQATSGSTGRLSQLLSCSSAAKPSDSRGGCTSRGGQTPDQMIATAIDAASGEGAAVSTSKQAQHAAEQHRQAAREPKPLGCKPVCSGSGTVDRSRPLKAMCGVRVMWTSVEARRRGVATMLLDCARSQVVCGYVVPRRALAFTQPTPEGQAFIQRYTGATQFLVY